MLTGCSIQVQKQAHSSTLLLQQLLGSTALKFHTLLQIFEKKPTATKNFGLWVRYQSRTGYHNMFKEYRDVTLNGAVEQMYTEMASRHRVRSHQIHIIKTTVVKAADCKRENICQFLDSKIKFPVTRKCVCQHPFHV
jgi:ribosomal protein L20A (L18A)